MAGTLDLPTLRQAMRIYAEALRQHREELDSLNVYPVPDGDTGTNMLLTQEAVVAALQASEDSEGQQGAGEVGAMISRASLMGARGNSGVILSQILRGIVEAMPDGGTFGPREMAASLRHAADEAYGAVARPAEGTVLSVIRDAAAAAGTAAALDGAGCDDVLRAALDEARASLARTRDQLPDLKRAGVVDAGGKGIVLLLDALLASVSGEETSEPVGALGPVGTPAGQELRQPLELAYEVQYLLEAPDHAVGPLRSALGELGDSLVVVGGGGLFNVHVHTNEPERTQELGRRAGRLRDVQVVSLEGRVAECLGGQARAVQVAEQVCALVAVAEGEGLGRAFRSLGAVVVAGGPGNNPAVSELVAAIEAAPAGRVLVLPNHPNVIPAAERAVASSSKEAWVVPARSVATGLAGATVFNPLLALEDNAAAMKEAVDRARGGEVALAHRAADTQAGPVHRGQWLGLIDGEAVAVADAAADAAVGVARRLAGEDSEVLTLVIGADAAAEDRRSVEAALRGSFPDLAVEVLEGGQPRYPFLLGVE